MNQNEIQVQITISIQEATKRVRQSNHLIVGLKGVKAKNEYNKKLVQELCMIIDELRNNLNELIKDSDN